MSSIPESALEIVTVPEIVDHMSKSAIDYIETISPPILFDDMLRDQDKRHEKAKCSEIFGFDLRVLTPGECTTFNLDSSKDYFIITSIENGSVAFIIGLKVGDVLIGVYNTNGIIRQIFDFVDEDALYNMNGNRLFNDRTILYVCFRVLRYVYRHLLNFELEYVNVLSLDLNILKHTLRFALPYTNNDVNDTIIDFGSVYFEKYIDGLTDYTQQMGGAKGDKPREGEEPAVEATAAAAAIRRPQGPGAGVRRPQDSRQGTQAQAQGARAQGAKPQTDAIRNLLDDIKKYSDFENFILKSSKYFIKDIIGNEIDELVVTDCWINICGNGGHQPFHNHGNSYISGTYYLNYDPKIHSNLRFNSPFKFKDPGVQFMELNIDKYTQFNSKDVTCNFINEGMLVLWPSNLIHGYSDNSGEDRITVSMNIMPKRIKTGPYSFTVNR